MFHSFVLTSLAQTLEFVKHWNFKDPTWQTPIYYARQSRHFFQWERRLECKCFLEFKWASFFVYPFCGFLDSLWFIHTLHLCTLRKIYKTYKSQNINRNHISLILYYLYNLTLDFRCTFYKNLSWLMYIFVTPFPCIRALLLYICLGKSQVVKS